MVPKLDLSGIVDVLVKLGEPAELLAGERPLVERLAELTEGEPILVRYYSRDLWDRSQSGARITKADLNALKPGFASYFGRWFNLQEKLWKDEGVSIDRSEVERVLSILAFAYGPFESCDLLELIEVTYGARGIVAEHSLLEPLRRFIIGNGQPSHGYVLAHPKIGEYLKEERFGGRSEMLKAAFVKWGKEQLTALNGDTSRLPKVASPYALQFLRKHFEDAKVLATDWMQFVENGWRLAWEGFEGGPRGFAGDVSAAWNAIRLQTPPPSIAAEWRCALVLSSIRGIGSIIPASLLIEAVKHDLLPLSQAAYFAANSEGVDALTNLAESVSDPTRHANLIAAALQKAATLRGAAGAEALAFLVPYLSAERRDEAFRNALTEIKAMRDSEGPSRLLGWFLAISAPYLSSQQVSEAYAMVTAIGDNRERVLALQNLAWFLSPEQWRCLSPAQLSEGFVAAMAIEDDRVRARTLASFAPHLSAEQVNEAIAAAGAIVDERCLATALEGLAPRLSTEQLDSALAAAMAISDEIGRSLALVPLAIRGPIEQRAELLGEALAAIRAIHTKFLYVPGANWLSLESQMSEEQVNEEFATAMEIADVRRRICAIWWIKNRLSDQQISKALVEVETLGGEIWHQNDFEFLAQLLPADQFARIVSEAFAVAKAHVMSGERASALADLAPHLSAEQLGEALAAVKAIRDGYNRVRALGVIAGHLPLERRDEVLDEALAAAIMTGDEHSRAKALKELAPLLPAEQLREAIAAANEIGNNSLRTRALELFGRYLLVKQRAEVLGNAPDAATLQSIAQYSSSEQLDDALDSERRSEVHDEALAGAKLTNDEARLAELISLASNLSAAQLTEALAIADEHTYRKVLRYLAPRLSTEQLTEMFVEGISSWRSRLVWIGFESNLPLERLTEVFSDSRLLGTVVAIRDDCKRVEMLVPLAIYGVASQYPALLSCLIAAAAKCSRSVALDAISASAHISAALGGTEALMDIRRAINDTARWYP